MEEYFLVDCFSFVFFLHFSAVKVKYGLRKLNISTRLVIAVVRIIVVVTIMSYAAQGRVKPHLFFNVLTSYSFRFKQT